MRILLLNTRNEVLGIQEIYVGNVNSSVVRAAEVFRPAVQANAPSIIVVRNHPSGDPAPSSQDVDITNELISAGKLLGIELLDHVVLGQRQPIRQHERTSVRVHVNPSSTQISAVGYPVALTPETSNRFRPSTE